MSALDHKRTFGPILRMSALPPQSGHQCCSAICPLSANSGHPEAGLTRTLSGLLNQCLLQKRCQHRSKLHWLLHVHQVTGVRHCHQLRIASGVSFAI